MVRKVFFKKRFLISKLFLILFVTTNAQAEVSCKEECAIVGGFATLVIGQVTYVWNPIIGQFVVPATGLIVTPYVCDYICEDRDNGGGRSLCIDNSRYLGDGTAAKLDPYDCIRNPRSSDAYVHYSCDGKYSKSLIRKLINADPGKALFDCTDGIF